MSSEKNFKYRKKPVVIEAFQWLGYLQTGDMPKWLTDASEKGVVVAEITAEPKPLFIKTLEGDMKAEPGDYVLKGVAGEIYPCKPDIFEQTYERNVGIVDELVVTIVNKLKDRNLGFRKKLK